MSVVAMYVRCDHSGCTAEIDITAEPAAGWTRRRWLMSPTPTEIWLTSDYCPVHAKAHPAEVKLCPE